MQPAKKLGLGLFIILATLIFTIFALAHLLSDESLYGNNFPIFPVSILSVFFFIGIYLIYKSINQITKEEEMREIEENERYGHLDENGEVIPGTIKSGNYYNDHYDSDGNSGNEINDEESVNVHKFAGFDNNYCENGENYSDNNSSDSEKFDYFDGDGEKILHGYENLAYEEAYVRRRM